MRFTTHARIWPAALALFFGAALAGAASANAQAVGSKPEASQPGFPTGEQALLGKSPRLTIQLAPAAEFEAVGGAQAMLHRFGWRPVAPVAIEDAGASRPVCGEMALLHRHPSYGRMP